MYRPHRQSNQLLSRHYETSNSVSINGKFCLMISQSDSEKVDRLGLGLVG